MQLSQDIELNFPEIDSIFYSWEVLPIVQNE